MTFSILFIGDRNVGRSVLAAERTTHELRRIWPRSADEVRVRSAGMAVLPGIPTPTHLETVAARRDLAVDTHQPAAVAEVDLERADLVLTMTRKQRAQILLQYPKLRTRVFALLEFVAAERVAVAGRRGGPIGRGERLEQRLRQVAATVAGARDRVTGQDDTDWDVFDPYAYSLDIYETVATTIDNACTALVHEIAVLTGARGGLRTSSQTA